MIMFCAAYAMGCEKVLLCFGCLTIALKNKYTVKR